MRLVCLRNKTLTYLNSQHRYKAFPSTQKVVQGSTACLPLCPSCAPIPSLPVLRPHWSVGSEDMTDSQSFHPVLPLPGFFPLLPRWAAPCSASGQCKHPSLTTMANSSPLCIHIYFSFTSFTAFNIIYDHFASSIISLLFVYTLRM